MGYKRICGWILCLCVALSTAWGGESYDLRVVVDVSGSMKKTDPDNLRASAVRLLARLIPAGGQAGIIRFGQRADILVPVTPVNEGWRNRVATSTRQIHSKALFTNIGAALEKGMQGWDTNNGQTKRYMVLLTDGVVDITKDPEKNAAERRRIKTVLPQRIKQSGAKLFTIGLSAAADHTLLAGLSEISGGQHHVVANAESLERVFLRLFEQMIRPNALPIKGQRFSVDKTVGELTVLVFHADNKAKISLLNPAGKRIVAKTVVPGVVWHQESRYDLITITSPTSGEWQIEGPVDPDNRAIIISDLTLELEAPPGSAFMYEQLALKVFLADGGEVITRSELLGESQILLEMEYPSGMQQQLPMQDGGHEVDQMAHDGHYTAEINTGGDAGVMSLILRAEGPTFQRERRHYFDLLPPPITLSLHSLSSQKGDSFIQVDVDSGLVKVDATKVSLTRSSNRYHSNSASQGPWQISLQDEMLAGIASFHPWVLGETVRGRGFKLLLPPLKLPEIARITEDDGATQKEGAVPSQTDTAQLGKDQQGDQPTQKVSIWVWIGTGILNLLILGGLFFAYRYLRQRDSAQLAKYIEPDAEASKGQQA